MKKITFLMSLLVVVLGYAQTPVVLENFDGATAPTIGFANGPGSATIIADPTGTGDGNVLEIITGAAAAPWQQAEITLQGDFMDLTGSTKEVSVDVYSLTAFDMLARVQGGINPSTGANAADAATDASHGGTGWETLTFNFNNPQDIPTVAEGVYQQILLFNLWNSTTNGWVCGADNCSPVVESLADNITAVAATPPPTCTDGVQNGDETGVDCGGSNCGPCPNPPTVGAPTPPNRSPENVRSIFSDAYNDIVVDSFDSTDFCQSGVTTDVLVDGNPTKLITGLGCEGITFLTGRFDATAYDFFHIDIYTESPTQDKSWNMKLSNWGGGAGEVNALEYSATNANILPSTNPGTWISFDINLSSWTAIGGADRSDLVQFIITSDLGTVYYDNVYLHNNNLSTDEFASSNFKVFPNPTLNNWNIESASVINSILVYDILGKQVASLKPNATSAEISSTNLTAGMYFAKIQGETGSKTIKLIKE